MPGSAPTTPPWGGGMRCVVGGAVTAVWRVVVVVVSGVEHETNIKPSIESAEMRMIDFFIGVELPEK